MATYLFIGQKGSGKSATLTQRIHDTLYDILVRKIGEDRIIVTDVAIKFQKLRREFLARYQVDIEGKIYCRKSTFKHTQWLRRFYCDRGPDRLVFEHYVADDTGYKAVRLAAPPRQRVVYVLDEVIVGFRARDTMRCWNAEVEYYMEFEDQIGDDVYCATQHEDLVDVNFLRLCNHVIRLVNTEQRMLFGFRIPGWMAGGRFLSRWYSDASPSAPVQRVEARRFISWMAECYNTDSLHSRGGERHENKLGRHWAWAVVPALIFLILFGALPFIASRQWQSFWKGKSMTVGGVKPVKRVVPTPVTGGLYYPPTVYLPAVKPIPLRDAVKTEVVFTNKLVARMENIPLPPKGPDQLVTALVATPVFIVSAMSLDGVKTRLRWSNGDISEDEGKWVGWRYTSSTGAVFDPANRQPINPGRQEPVRSAGRQPGQIVPEPVNDYVERLSRGGSWK